MMYYISPTNKDLMHHGVKGQKWGVRNGPPYPLNSSSLSKKIHKYAKKIEPEITKDVKSAVVGSGSDMYGTQYRLKTESSIKRKIETDSQEKGITLFKAADGIKDSVRYTAVSTDNDFVDHYNKIKKSLESKGYKEVRCRNYFVDYEKGLVKHKSVQSVFKTRDGWPFEIQFQTPASQDAKDKKVPIYEERRKPNLSKERQLELEKQMTDLAESVPTPKDIHKIKAH